ncbi:hypothetical protein CVT26_009959 [Gymnopilus dilepis]|uniref:Uncharacterized protein n=1 Tax=Gymnopilus dilepis TaxID=231916 RepID=A0A409VL89_9AGAR|nr:hypothetical protein CVT26_009959 [Gymnopilus dilepis]
MDLARRAPDSSSCGLRPGREAAEGDAYERPYLLTHCGNPQPALVRSVIEVLSYRSKPCRRCQPRLRARAPTLNCIHQQPAPSPTIPSSTRHHGPDLPPSASLSTSNLTYLRQWLTPMIHPFMVVRSASLHVCTPKLQHCGQNVQRTIRPIIGVIGSTRSSACSSSQTPSQATQLIRPDGQLQVLSLTCRSVGPLGVHVSTLIAEFNRIPSAYLIYANKHLNENIHASDATSPNTIQPIALIGWPPFCTTGDTGYNNRDLELELRGQGSLQYPLVDETFNVLHFSADTHHWRSALLCPIFRLSQYRAYTNHVLKLRLQASLPQSTGIDRVPTVALIARATGHT